MRLQSPRPKLRTRGTVLRFLRSIIQSRLLKRGNFETSGKQKALYNSVGNINQLNRFIFLKRLYFWPKSSSNFSFTFYFSFFLFSLLLLVKKIKNLQKHGFSRQGLNVILWLCTTSGFSNSHTLVTALPPSISIRNRDLVRRGNSIAPFLVRDRYSMAIEWLLLAREIPQGLFSSRKYISRHPAAIEPVSSNSIRRWSAKSLFFFSLHFPKKQISK